jgi:enoyl-CoA hydratase
VFLRQHLHATEGDKSVVKQTLSRKEERNTHMRNEGRVTTERQDHVLLIGLDRPEKRNAFDPAMLHALSLAYRELDRARDLRCGVLFAHGNHFTARLDLAQMAPLLARGQLIALREGVIDPLGLTGPRLTKPVVCAVQGICMTLGIELLMATNVRIVASTARFAHIEIKRGIYPVGGAMPCATC